MKRNIAASNRTAAIVLPVTAISFVASDFECILNMESSQAGAFTTEPRRLDAIEIWERTPSWRIGCGDRSLRAVFALAYAHLVCSNVKTAEVLVMTDDNRSIARTDVTSDLTEIDLS